MNRILTYSSKILLVLTIVVLIFHFLFLGIQEDVDSGTFIAFANFIKTGTYKWSFYYTNNIIHTGSPPLYSLLLNILSYTSILGALLHAIQIAMLIISGILVYKILLTYFSKANATIISCLFVLFPGNLYYTDLLLSEIGCQFLFMIYSWLIFRYIKTKKSKYISLSVLVGSIAGLWRFSFIIFGLLSFIFLLYKHPKKIIYYFVGIIGPLLILGWIIIQSNLTGVTGLVDDPGIRYNIQMMWRAKKVPPETDPSVIEIRKFIPTNVDLRRPYWDLERYLFYVPGNNYIKNMKIIGDVGKAAMYMYPLDYLRVVVATFFETHTSNPYTYLDNWGNWTLYESFICKSGKDITYGCTPIISSTFAPIVWKYFARIANWVYHVFIPLWSFCIFFPALVLSFFTKQKIILFSMLFIVGRIPIAMATFPDPRYLVPFYPHMLIISVVMIQILYKKIHLVKIK